MHTFSPKDPEFRGRVEQSFARQAFMQTLGAKLVAVAPGRVEITLARASALTQQHGFLHAGAVTSVVDSACGYAALSLMPPGVAVLTVEFKVNLLSPARAPRFVAVGSVKKAGRTLMVSTGEVVGIDGEQRVPVAMMTATVMVVQGRGLRD